MLKEKATSLEDKKSVTFVKITSLVNELQGPPLIKTTLILFEEMETKLTRLKGRWDEEFDNLINFSGDDMHMWIVHYVNINHNIFFNLSEDHDELLDIERELFQMKIKKEITIPSMRDHIFDWVEK